METIYVSKITADITDQALVKALIPVPGSPGLYQEVFVPRTAISPGGSGTTDLQTAYDNGRVVNGQTVTFDANGQIGLGNQALQDSTATLSVALGEAAARDSSGTRIIAIGLNAGRGNTAPSSNFFGENAGWDGDTETGNTTAFGVTCFSLASIPQYNNHAAAAAAMTVANGCVANTVYIYLNTTDNTVGFIIPT